MTTIPCCDIVVDSWEKASFGDAKESAASHETLEVANEAHACHYNAPRNHDKGQPDAWPDSLHHYVAWYLGRDIEREENSEGDVILEAFHMKIGFEVEELCIADIGSVEET